MTNTPAPIAASLLRIPEGRVDMPPPEPAGCRAEDPACGVPGSRIAKALNEQNRRLDICVAQVRRLSSAVIERDLIQSGAGP